MGVSKILFASALFLAGTALPAQSAPLDRTEILGRLALSYSPSYIAHLGKRHGFSFTPSAEFISQVKRGGGDGILAESLYSAQQTMQASVLAADDHTIDHLAKCAELIHNGSSDIAEQECRESIDESPRSPWPLIIVADFVKVNRFEEDPSESEKAKTDERKSLLDRAAGLAPGVTAVDLYRDEGQVVVAGDSGELGDKTLEFREYSFARASDDNLLIGFDLASSERLDPEQKGRPVEPTFLHQVELEPELALPRTELANAYFSVGDIGNGELQFKEAIRLEPDNPSLHSRFAQLLFNSRDREGCLAELREAVRSAPAGVNQHLEMSEALENYGETEEAIKVLREAIAAHPADLSVSNNLVALFVKHHNLSLAIDERQRSLGVSRQIYNDPEEFEQQRRWDLIDLAYMLQDNKQLEAAATQFRFLLGFEPESSELHNDFGNVLGDQHNIEAALGEYYEAIRLDPAAVEAHANVAMYLAKKSDLDGAIAEYKTAIEIRPTDDSSRIFLGTLLAKKGDRESANEQFRIAMEQGKTNPDLQLNMAYALTQLGDEAGAIDHLKTALDLKPDSPGAENDLAWIYCTSKDVRLRDPKAALDLARRAVRTSPAPNPAFLDTLAEAELLNGRRTEALASEMQAVQLDPDNHELQDRLQHFRDAADVAKSLDRLRGPN